VAPGQCLLEARCQEPHGRRQGGAGDGARIKGGPGLFAFHVVTLPLCRVTFAVPATSYIPQVVDVICGANFRKLISRRRRPQGRQATPEPDAAGRELGGKDLGDVASVQLNR
jgi:hypothetical protein